MPYCVHGRDDTCREGLDSNEQQTSNLLIINIIPEERLWVRERVHGGRRAFKEAIVISRCNPLPMRPIHVRSQTSAIQHRLSLYQPL